MMRWRIECDYHELKQEVGLGHFEGRSWRGFHHHATMCIAAYGFLVSERGDLPLRTSIRTFRPGICHSLGVPLPRFHRSGLSGMFPTRSRPYVYASTPASSQPCRAAPAVPDQAPRQLCARTSDAVQLTQPTDLRAAKRPHASAPNSSLKPCRSASVWIAALASASGMAVKGGRSSAQPGSPR